MGNPPRVSHAAVGPLSDRKPLGGALDHRSQVVAVGEDLQAFLPLDSLKRPWVFGQERLPAQRKVEV